ncbi:MAG: molybdenum cofactor guanylyltransferase [Halanaeroarchaeum sp.]
MSERPDRSAVVVCGGRSERFGERDKVFADLAGRPLVTHVLDRVAPVVEEVVVNCHPDQHDRMADAIDRPATRLAVDDRPGEGPLAGLERGFEAANGRYALAVACDMPFVDPAFVEVLFEQASRVEAAIPRQSGGWFQPLQAVYAVDPLSRALEDAATRGISRPIEPARALEHVIVWDVPEGDDGPDTLFNVNTPADLAAAEAALD